MKIEDRLSDAMHHYAETIEPSDGSWPRIRARFDDGGPPRRPTHGRLVLAGVAITVVIVLIAVLAVRDDGATNRVATDARGAVASMPSRIFAITVDGAPVVLDSATGQRLDGFGSTAGMAEGTQVAVTPDGTSAYVVKGNGNAGCAEHSIEQMSTDPNALSVGMNRALATSPTVSPDGRYLAFLSCRQGQNRAEDIVLNDLSNGQLRVTPAPPGTFFINRLQFAADSRHVLFDLYVDTLGRDVLREIDIVAGEPAPGRDVGAQGWVGIRGTTGEYLGVLGTPPSVVSMQGPSPFTTGPLFAVPAIPTEVASDRSGNHILAVVDDNLYRWSVGDEKPTKLLGSYVGAAWIPDAGLRRTGPAPAGVLIAKRDGELGVFGAQDGRQHRSLGTFPGISSVATTADGDEVVFAAPGTNGACGDTAYFDVTKLTPATGETTRVVAASGAPAVSPDGQYVAVGVSCAGPSLGFTSLVNGENFGADALGSVTTERSPGIRVVDPLGWSPDSTRLVYRVHLEADDVPEYYVGRLWPVVRQARTQVVKLPDSSDISAAAFVDDATVAVAVPGEATTKVRRWTLANGSRPTTSPTIFEIAGRVTAIVADPRGEHLLLVTEDQALYRWSMGDAEPTKLADGVVSAAWIPWS